MKNTSERKKYIAVLAALFARSNGGHGLPRQSQIDWLKNMAIKRVNNPIVAETAGNWAVEMVAELIESDEMEKVFYDEGRQWYRELMKMTDVKIQMTWPDMWDKVRDMVPNK